MLERTDINQNNQEQPTEPSPVRDSWFHSHFEGNILFPQKMRVIRIYEASAILADPPYDWQDLRNSQLSKKQTGIASLHMNISHDREKIPRFTEEYRINNKPNLPKSTSVGLSRFNELWKSGADGVLRMIMQKIDHERLLPSRESVNNGPIEMMSSEDVNRINQFWHNSQNRAKKAHMREAGKVIHDFLHNPKGENYMKSLSELWKSAISKRITEEHLAKFYTSDLTKKYLTTKHGHDRFDSDVVLAFLSKFDILKQRPTNTDANEDLIFQEAQNAIQIELDSKNLEMPFGLKFDPRPINSSS